MRFTFNASAIGAGGVIHRGGVTTTIPSLASLALAPTGGEGRSVEKNYYSEELAFSHAETRVYGRELPDGRSFTTFTYVLIKDLNIFDRLLIAEMRATVTSTRLFEDEDDHPFELELSYEGVRIKKPNDRKELNLDPKDDASVKSVRRYQHLEQILNGRPLPDGLVPARDKKALAERFNARSPEHLTRRMQERKAVQGSMIAAVDGDVPARRHHKVFIDGLGTVIFGELMLKPGRRRLNLLRIEFGNRQEALDFDNEAPEADSQENVRVKRSVARSTQEGPEDFDSLGGSMTLASVEGNGTIVGP